MKQFFKEMLPFLAALVVYGFAEKLILSKVSAHLENLIEGE